MRFAILGLLIVAGLSGWSQVAPASRPETNREPTSVAVCLFFGTGANDEAGRKAREMTGVTPYEPGEVQLIEEVRDKAIEAVKKEGHPIDGEYTCAANIQMSTGTCTLLLDKAGAPHYQVSFNSAGEISRVSGAKGPHGEGAWHRDYVRGQPGTAGNSRPAAR
jgi:hypothetical protein